MNLSTNNSCSVIPSTYQAFLKDLKSGRFQPGELLPGERELAKLYGIGRSSMVKVLKQLTSDRYIERVQGHGTFVRKDLKERVEPLVISVASMDIPELSSIENPFAWEAVSDILRGLINESSKHRGIHLNWYCCPESTNPSVIQNQLEDLMEPDGVIFNGCGMDTLKSELFRQGKPALTLGPNLLYRKELFPIIDYDRWGIFPEYPRMLLKKYPGRPIVLLSHIVAECDTEELAKYKNEFSKVFREAGREIYDVHIPSEHRNYNFAKKSLQDNLSNLHLEKEPLIVVLNRLLVSPLYILLRDMHLEIPIAALIGGTSLESLHANILHWREPFFEMGTVAVKQLTEHLRSGKELEDIIFPLQFCEY